MYCLFGKNNIYWLWNKFLDKYNGVIFNLLMNVKWVFMKVLVYFICFGFCFVVFVVFWDFLEFDSYIYLFVIYMKLGLFVLIVCCVYR